MSDQITEPTKPVQAAPKREGTTALVSDLSRRIELAVVREPLDTVRCMRVFGDFYRCNWWSRLDTKQKQTGFNWGELTTGHIRQSHFLKATVRGDELILEYVPSSGAQRKSLAV